MSEEEIKALDCICGGKPWISVSKDICKVYCARCPAIGQGHGIDSESGSTSAYSFAVKAWNAFIMLARAEAGDPDPVPMLLWCPGCGARHHDVGEFAKKRHHTHACQSCGMCWRPAVLPTVGVEFLPGFKNHQEKP